MELTPQIGGEIKSAVRQDSSRASEDITQLSHFIHRNPELAFAEHKSAAEMLKYLEGYGFSVESGQAGMPTAFIASKGSGPLVVAVFAEYDALPGVGHACGHNIIAGSALGVANLLQTHVDALGITLKIVGSPAEEGGGGKIHLLDQGYLDGVHLAMMVHAFPWELPNIDTLATSHFTVSYTGKESHASVAPERGVNAGDAMTIAQVAIGLLRQQVEGGSRIHGITVKGGEAPNIIPAHVTGSYIIRAADLDAVHALRARVEKCFEAGALATGAKLEITDTCPPYSEMRPDQLLTDLYVRNAESIGRNFDGGAELAAQLRGSTDMANVSLKIPAIHPMVALDCGEAMNHQPDFTQFCGKPTGDKAAVEGALAMALTVVDAASNPAARKYFLEYKSPK